MKAVFKKSITQRIFDFVASEELKTGNTVEAVSLAENEWRYLVAETPEYIESTKKGYLFMSDRDRQFLVARFDMDVDAILYGG